MCGIVGVMNADHASGETLQALMVLQHRGQDAAGILSHEMSAHRFHLQRSHGLINTALPESSLKDLPGEMAIGHNRYATVALKTDKRTRELQPQFVNYPDGLALAHNGNIPDAGRLKTALAQQHRRALISDNDVEVVLNLLALGLAENESGDEFTRLTRAVRTVMDEALGGYACVGVWGGRGLFAFRDPKGLRPLVIGKKIVDGKLSWMLASETSALLFTGHSDIRDVLPGELVFIDRSRTLHSHLFQASTTAHCFFEWIYFSSEQSTIDGLGVHQVRHRLGEELVELIEPYKDKIDVVVPVPDTARPAAISIAEELSLPYRELLIKNRYIQRSFILPTQSQREMAVYHKLTAVTDGIRGKRILLVDDSIVRGTTSKRIISLLKEAGASSVILASTSPAITHPCYFGIDFPDHQELISAKLDATQLAHTLGAEAVIFQSQRSLRAALKDKDICSGCLDGRYPVDVVQSAERFIKHRSQGETLHDTHL